MNLKKVICFRFLPLDREHPLPQRTISKWRRKPAIHPAALRRQPAQSELIAATELHTQNTTTREWVWAAIFAPVTV